MNSGDSSKEDGDTLEFIGNSPMSLQGFSPDPEHNPEPPLIEDTDKEEEQAFSDQSRQQE